MSQPILNVIAGLYNPFAHEALTVGASVLSLSSSVYEVPVSPNQALRQVQYAVVTSDSGSATLRYTFDGSTPVAGSFGHQLAVSSSMVLIGYQAISQFKAVSDTGSNVVLQVTYER